jgi:hypothetical protein
VAVGAMILLLAAILPGIPYWMKIGVHPARCIYGDPICSLTVSTYLLGCLTLAAFLAAYKAARYTQEALEHEKQPALSAQVCSSKHKRPPLRFYITDVKRGFEIEPPKNFHAVAFQTADFELISVGRSPVVNGMLEISARNASGEIFPLHIDVGSIRAGKAEHVTMFFAPELSSVTFNWSEHATHMKGYAITFHARDEVIERSAVAALSEPAVPPPSNAPLTKPASANLTVQ